MKKIFAFLLLVTTMLHVQAQCNQANPFCTGTNYSFPNSTNVNDLGMVDCLFSTPNPVWYFMEIDQNGPMTLSISQVDAFGFGIDVDFALWGPYPSLAAGCGGGTFPVGAPIDCSYSPNPTETATIPNAQVGQFYILLLTNYSNDPGTISFSQTGGTGSADCSFVCGVTGFTANPTACANNLYNLSGTLSINNPPATGTLTISSSCGGSPQVFNAPFSNSINYNLTGLNANGSNCQVTAVFSANANCNTFQPYVAPAPCNAGPCSFGNFTGSITNCDPVTNQYTITGSINYTNAPASGTLTLSNSCGGSQVFNAPFGSSSNFSLTGTANGNSCVVTATFSANGNCSATLTYPTPPACNCNALMGTFTTTLQGLPTINPICYGDSFSITTNNDFNVPAEIPGATTPGSPNYDPTAPTYDPGMIWLIYSCPPTVSLDPLMAQATGLDIPDDPCLVGIASNTGNLNDLNDLSTINSFPAGTFTNNVVYYVPLTMYSVQDGIYSYIIVPNLQCFDMGNPIAVQYLPEVTANFTSNCANGTASVTVSGGSPELNGTAFTASNLLPASAGFAVNTALNNGIILVNNLSTSGPFSFDLTDDAGCLYPISGNYVGPDPVTLSYPDTLYCLSDPNPLATITGLNGGTISAGIGIAVNPSTGEVDLSNSSPGSYVITYTSPAAVCPGVDDFLITIAQSPTIDAGNDKVVCFGNAVQLDATGANSYVWNVPVANGMSYMPPVGTTELIVTGTNGSGCSASDTLVIEALEDCTGEDLVYWVPNTFTPDGDQHNQTFKPVFFSGYDPYEFAMYIFDRWGELVYETRNVKFGWDGSTGRSGKKAPDGVYTWKIVFKALNNDEKIQEVGHVTLLR